MVPNAECNLCVKGHIFAFVCSSSVVENNSISAKVLASIRLSSQSGSESLCLDELNFG